MVEWVEGLAVRVPGRLVQVHTSLAERVGDTWPVLIILGGFDFLGWLVAARQPELLGPCLWVWVASLAIYIYTLVAATRVEVRVEDGDWLGYHSLVVRVEHVEFQEDGMIALKTTGGVTWELQPAHEEIRRENRSSRLVIPYPIYRLEGDRLVARRGCNLPYILILKE